MAVHLITYDLRKPGQDYYGLFEAIQALGTNCHCEQSVWLVKTNYASVQLKAYLQSRVDTNDMLMVMEVGKDYATQGLKSDTVRWLKLNMPD